MKDLANVTPKDLSRLSSKDLLAVYNANASKPIARFADYPSALRRTKAVLESAQLKRTAQPVEKANGKKARTKVLVAPVNKPAAIKEYHSVLAAFLALGLPVVKHQRFRRQLKLAGKATFGHFTFTATY